MIESLLQRNNYLFCQSNSDLQTSTEWKPSEITQTSAGKNYLKR